MTNLNKKFNDRMMFSKTVIERLENECVLDTDIGQPEQPVWLAVGITNDGHAVIMKNFNNMQDSLGLGVMIEPPAHQVAYAIDMVKALNREAGHDGMWIMAYTHPPLAHSLLAVEPDMSWRRTAKIWLDQEGDPQFTIECVNSFAEIVATPITHYIEEAERAHKNWNHLMRSVLDPKENQLVAKATIAEK